VNPYLTPNNFNGATLALIHFILIWTIAAGCNIRKRSFTPNRTRSSYSGYSVAPSPFALLGLFSSSPTPSLLDFRPITLLLQCLLRAHYRSYTFPDS
jgi:hypothetical protein